MHDKLSVNSVCFPGASLQELATYWRTLGAHRVSMVSPQLLTEPVSTVRDILTTGNFKLETICHPFLPFQPLDKGTEALHDARARLTQLIPTAQQLGANSIYMLTGGHGVLTWEQAAEAFSTAIAPCVAQAKDAGVALAIENASVLFADNHIAHSLRDATALAEMAGIGVCIDLYACWTEAELHKSIERAISRCHVVQISDYVYGDRSIPCRAVPGDGAVPLQRILKWLLDAGYKGAFDFELIGPRIDQEGHLNAVRRSAQYMDGMLNTLGVR